MKKETESDMYKKIEKTIYKMTSEYEKKPVELNFLETIFKNWNGLLFSNMKQKQAIAVYPHKNGLVIEFFEILPDEKCKFIDGRAITIYDFSKEKLIHMINLCEIINKREIEKENESFDYHG